MRQIQALFTIKIGGGFSQIYVQQRYPKDDKRLAALNWKMDQMLESGKEYLDTQFPENQRLVDRIKKATKKADTLPSTASVKFLAAFVVKVP